MQSVRNPCSLTGVALFFAALVGCGDSGPKIVPVTGTLTYKGHPVTNATIWFQPETGRPSWGQTDEQGKFKLSYDRTHEGMVVGKHKMWLERRPTTQAEREADMMGRALPTSRDTAALFQKYSQESSTYTVEVNSSTRELSLNLD
jgi:hypothetical protein